MLRPDGARKVGEKQAAQKSNHDAHANEREYQVGDSIMARSCGCGPMERKGPLSYVVQLDSGILWRQHIDRLRESVTTPAEEEVGNYPTDTNEISDYMDEQSHVSESESGRDPGESDESDISAEMSGQNESPTLELGDIRTGNVVLFQGTCDTGA